MAEATAIEGAATVVVVQMVDDETPVGEGTEVRISRVAVARMSRMREAGALATAISAKVAMAVVAKTQRLAQAVVAVVGQQAARATVTARAATRQAIKIRQRQAS